MSPKVFHMIKFRSSLIMNALLFNMLVKIDRGISNDRSKRGNAGIEML